MFQENRFLNKLLDFGRKVIPRRIFRVAQPVYHWGLGMLGAVVFGFPSRSMRVIAVTGTKGKSTVVYMTSKILEDQGVAVAAVGSLGFKIKDKTWPNTLKMTMPGRMKLQKFLWRAKKAGVKFVVLEATSEGLAQQRLAGTKVDCAVYTNLHREHLESHGSFENYMAAKQELFLKTRETHVLNIDDQYFKKFANFPARHKVTYGQKWGVITRENLKIKKEKLNIKLLGEFNEYNALAALAVAHVYNLDMDKAVGTLNSIESIPGRMEIVRSPDEFDVVIDYAHTPDSLELVYQALRQKLNGLSTGLGASTQTRHRLVCVLGAAGGGRDKWKRPEFGRVAEKYCDQVILTNEDPYDEAPQEIIGQIEKGFSSQAANYRKILDRKEAIKTALTLAQNGDIIAITGKGSETSMAVAGGQRMPWSDKGIIEELLKQR